MGGNSSASHISIMINTFFNLNKKKDNILKKSEIPNEFFSRFFKNIFQNFGSFLSFFIQQKGRQFYENTWDKILELSSDYQVREKQFIVAYYISGLVKSLDNW